MEKRIMFICLLGIITSTVNAQILGLKAGFSFANGKHKLSGTVMPTNSLMGLNTGIIGELPVSESFYLSSGMLLIKKGTERDIPDAEVKIRVRYLEFPLYTVYKHDFITWKLFMQSGPYAGVCFD
jgi:hypothetical protein